MNTQLAACGGCIAGAVITRILGGKTDIIMMLNGALAGLVSITAEPLMPSPMLSIVIGAIGGVIMYFGTLFLEKMRLDDVVGAIPVHMFAGIFGTLIVPLSNRYIFWNSIIRSEFSMYIRFCCILYLYLSH